jgi:SNF family Na+-dependent transporter
MPLILQKIPLAAIFGFMWFMMLFLAGITSSVSLAQPAVAFLEDEFNINRKKAAWIFGIITFLLCQPSIFLLGKGVVDELDFWGGTFCLVLFATIEIIIFAWVFGIDKAWEHMHYGAKMKIPTIYKFIIKYITPLFLFFILGFWFIQQVIPTFMMKEVSHANRPFVLGTRIGLVALFLILCILVKIAWRKRKMRSYH